jgi:hypothetical protein
MPRSSSMACDDLYREGFYLPGSACLDTTIIEHSELRADLESRCHDHRAQLATSPSPPGMTTRRTDSQAVPCLDATIIEHGLRPRLHLIVVAPPLKPNIGYPLDITCGISWYRIFTCYCT